MIDSRKELIGSHWPISMASPVEKLTGEATFQNWRPAGQSLLVPGSAAILIFKPALRICRTWVTEISDLEQV